MNKIDALFRTKKISKLNLDEKPRYLNFFSNSYKENLEHCRFNLEKFPRWSIISGYYAMHDITKLFLADKFNIKIDFNVHQTTIDVLSAVLKEKEIIALLNLAHNEFINRKKKSATFMLRFCYCVFLFGNLKTYRQTVPFKVRCAKGFLILLNDLAEARDKRTKVQYYTGSAFLSEQYKKDANKFLNGIALHYINKISNLKNVN